MEQQNNPRLGGASMEPPASIAHSSNYWYGEQGAVDRWFYGVFEGGGAKGVAYGGALLAMRERKCWFRAVAGASAGAITAALIASGLSPEEIVEATDSALKQVKTGIWAGLWRLQNETGYFPSNTLVHWIERHLKEQVAKESAARTKFIDSDSWISFQELYNATRIELNIVAADLSLKRQIIFSHLDTPTCSVAFAVVASSSIPFAFKSSLLHVPEGNSVYHHTIVDGGVWSNFPIFIFEDDHFRKYYGRDAIDPDKGAWFFSKGERRKTSPPRG